MVTDLIDFALYAAIASFMLCVLIVYTQRWHGNRSMDSEMDGVQKFHKRPVPRIGGCALIAGMLTAAGLGMLGLDDSTSGSEKSAMLCALLLLAAAPIFLAGLLEDLTKGISVSFRLVAAFVSAFLASWLLGATLPRLDIPGIDLLLRIAPLGMVVTAIAVAGVANSINIIDGFNGLAGSVSVIILAGLGLVAWQAGDLQVATLAVTGIGAATGFLLINYPTGRVFLGDGGAYLLGFWIAEVAVLTVVRNPNVGAWQILAICAYPVIEVLYSIYRKKVVRKMSPGLPDRLHFHMLVYRRFICRLIPENSAQPWIRNALVTCAIATVLAPLTLLSVRYGETIAGALSMLLIQIFLYLAIYARLVRGHWCLNPAVGLGLLPEHKAKSL